MSGRIDEAVNEINDINSEVIIDNQLDIRKQSSLTF